MNPFSFWSLLWHFAEFFVLAVAVAAVCYTLLRVRTWWGKGLSSILTLGVAVASVTELVPLLMLPRPTGALYLELFLGAIVVGGVLGALGEWPLEKARLPLGWLCLRCLCTSLCAVGGGLLLIHYIFNWLNSLGKTLDWIEGGRWGYFLGLLLTPFALSFFRVMIPALRLRPGMDAPLTHEGRAP